MAEPAWRFVRIGLIVTGRGEENFVGDFLRQLAETGHCSIQVLRFVGQRNPQSESNHLRMVATGNVIPDGDEKIGIEVRRWLANSELHYAIWLDDLESSTRPLAAAKFSRLRDAVDVLLAPVPEYKNRYSVHFFVNMVEAYYFAHPEAVQQVLGIDVKRHGGDCENVVHPKNELKRLAGRGGFDEKEQGASIVSKLDLEVVLMEPEHCRALRTLVAWCWEAIGEARTERFQLRAGVYWDVTEPQLVERVPPDQVGPLSPETSYLPVG